MVRLAFGNSPYLRPPVFPTPSRKAARRSLTVRQSFRRRGFLGGVAPSSGSRVHSCAQTATQIKKWQAEIVDADPVPGGVFRLAESGGMQIEGHYVEVLPCSKVVFTWGGIVGVAPGQSTVEFLLESSGTGTIVRLRHHNLPASSFDAHDREWARGL